jgi:hypothetical protein
MIQFNDRLYGRSQFQRRPKKVYHAYAQAVWEVLAPKNVLDVGCANAYALDWWQRQGIPVAGIEPAKAAYRFMPPAVKTKVKPLDLRRRLKLKTYDLVNFTEVAEHISAKYETIMLKNVIAAVSNFLIISWSNQPAFPEHVNPRPAIYVKFRLKRLGLFFEPELTRQLKRRLAAPVFNRWRHWEKNMLVFSRTPQAKRVLLRHFWWLPSYANKNLGYFAQAARQLGFGPRWAPNDWRSLFKRWRRVWLYPFEKHLLIKLLILKLFGNRVILKLDSQIFPVWRAWLAEKLVFKVIAETAAVARPFGRSKKIVFFAGGLPQKNLKLIKKLKIKRQKIILFAGRQTQAKGFDRLTKIIPAGWQLKLAADLPPKAYYRLIKQSSLVVLPTRGEGWPNVFADAWYCRRLFLTTAGARCGEAILDKTFYCPNSVNGLRRAVKTITANLANYYRRFNRLYDPDFFQITDPVFSRLLEKN